MSVALTARKLLTIVAESALEGTLIREIEALGARGYTITDARGKGGCNRRDAAWSPHANIRLEVLCNEATALAICEGVRDRCYANYSVIIYVSDVDVMRPEKF